MIQLSPHDVQGNKPRVGVGGGGEGVRWGCRSKPITKTPRHNDKLLLVSSST